MSEVMRATRWSTNAEMIADAARLGYVEGRVLDTTYGRFGYPSTKACSQQLLDTPRIR